MEGIDYSVKYLQDIKFDRLSFSEKVEIKRRGRLTPPLSFEQASSSEAMAEAIPDNLILLCMINMSGFADTNITTLCFVFHVYYLLEIILGQ